MSLCSAANKAISFLVSHQTLAAVTRLPSHTLVSRSLSEDALALDCALNATHPVDLQG